MFRCRPKPSERRRRAGPGWDPGQGELRGLRGRPARPRIRLLGPWASGPEDTGLPVAMTTGDCCHLPGSLCDCSGSPAFSKVVEATGLGPPQYVAQVTSRDGRLLSTVIRALDTPSDCPFCRICHEGANGESLLSPCGCAGTLGAVHRSCLEKWLSSSNTSYCELCHTEFAVEKRPRPLTEWLKDPGPRTEKRTLCCDMVCFLFITPLAAISGWLCLRGAQDHLRLHSRLEAVGLIALTIALFTIYVLWTLVSAVSQGAGNWGAPATSSGARGLVSDLGVFCAGGPGWKLPLSSPCIS
ncbi:Hypothetical predicted protein [Marmota monax]|uniref:E3 ubiquitin-protein ligase MARCHF2 n=1 Tax=Marmota monax TaxID=9995 RepID=A0A5E4BPZ6_MARMO|nr:Hypothetical predicted protein [Marmota monax]